MNHFPRCADCDSKYAKSRGTHKCRECDPKHYAHVGEGVITAAILMMMAMAGIGLYLNW